MRKVVGFFYREEREGAQRGFMGLGINREEREGAQRGRSLFSGHNEKRGYCDIVRRSRAWNLND